MVESERLRAQLQQQYFTCTVLKIPSGTFPKLITVRLPTIDSPANEARWFGTPPIEEGDSVICRRDPNDQDVLIIERSGDSPDPVFDILINNSGGALAANDVIVNDSSQDNSVTTTTTQSDKNSPGVIIGGADNGDEVMIKRIGVVTVILDATGSRGDFIQTSTTVKKVTPTLTINAGVFGQLLEAGILDDTVQAILFGLQGDLPASDIRIALGVGSPTVGQMQEYLDNTGSSGYFIGGEITDGGAGSINVAAGEGFIRETNNNNAPLLSFKWASSASIAVAIDTTQYVFVDDTGTISLDPNEFLEAQDNILIGLATNEGGIIESVFNLGVRLAESIGQAGRYIRRVHSIIRDVRKGGLIFGETGTRNITVTTGVLWWGRTEYTITALDTSVSGGFDTYSASGKEATAATQWPNAQYDNAGVLTTMTNNRWAVLFFYLEPDDHVVMMYGRNQYTSQASAGMEAVPASSIPPRLVSSGILAAKFIFQKNAATAANILSSFDQVFASAEVTDHGNLAGLGDNDHPQYLLTSAQLWSSTPNAVDIYRNSNVGIGDFSASNPNRKLHVNGDVEITVAGGGSASGSEAMEIVSTGNDGTVGEGAYINFTDGTNILAQIRSRAEAAGKYGLSFGTWDSGFAERIRIDASGNVNFNSAAHIRWNNETAWAIKGRTTAENTTFLGAAVKSLFITGGQPAEGLAVVNNLAESSLEVNNDGEAYIKKSLSIGTTTKEAQLNQKGTAINSGSASHQMTGAIDNSGFVTTEVFHVTVSSLSEITRVTGTGQNGFAGYVKITVTGHTSTQGNGGLVREYNFTAPTTVTQKSTLDIWGANAPILTLALASNILTIKLASADMINTFTGVMKVEWFIPPDFSSNTWIVS